MSDNNTNNKNESLIKIGNLNGKKFDIPAYQRGYKWEPKQVRQLLDDINEFITDTNKKNTEIYCIQPLIVKPSQPDEYERYNVVDGQQRLTTIKLILSCLSSDVNYDISYKTRIDSADFLNKTVAEMEKIDKKNNKPVYEKNIDYYHIYQVKKAIQEWFEGKEVADIESFHRCLKERVHFIWYEIKNNETEGNVFKRINEGKIPHTKAELIKGLLLNSHNYTVFAMNDFEVSEIHHKIAMEWDQLECALQDDEFWLFINKEYEEEKEKKMPARIEYILDLIVKLDVFEIKENSTYSYFEKYLNKKKKELHQKKEEGTLSETDKGWVNDIWTKVKSIYQILDEWYHNPTTFHYVGYLITVKEKMETAELINLWETSDKQEFIKKLENRIAEHLKKKYEKLYDKKKEKLVLNKFDFDQEKNSLKKQEVRDLLLLHNVETVLRQNQYLQDNKKYNMPNFTKFDFHLYKREKWEIEHIRPNSDNKFDSLDDIELYIRYAKISGIDFSGEERVLIDSYLSDISSGHKSSGDLITYFENSIRTLIEKKDGGISEEAKNKIWNYTLLDKSTNAGYGNYIFPVKRAYLFEKEKGFKIQPGTAAKHIKDDDIFTMEQEAIASDAIPFVPPCTRYIFTKYYNMNPTSFIAWTAEDAEAYLSNIEELLEKFGVEKTVYKGAENN